MRGCWSPSAALSTHWVSQTCSAPRTSLRANPSPGRPGCRPEGGGGEISQWTRVRRAQCQLGAGHSGRLDSIIENSVQLAIGIALDARRPKPWDRRRNMPDKRHTGILSIHAVAASAVLRESLLAIRTHLLRRVSQRNLPIFIANESVGAWRIL
jgi:hypothetical protein